MIPSRLSISNISWKYGSLVVKHPGEMSIKCRRNVGSSRYQKMRTPKLYIILKKTITKEMTDMQTRMKSICMFNAYERLKYAPPRLKFTFYYLQNPNV